MIRSARSFWVSKLLGFDSVPSNAVVRLADDLMGQDTLAYWVLVQRFSLT